jgi:hypothetical protein
MRDMNRRKAMTAVAAAAIMPTAALAAINPTADAELLAVGREYDALVKLLHDTRQRWLPNWEAQKRALAELPERNHTDDEIMAALRRADSEHPIADPHPDDISDMMDLPSRRIMALPATTVAGLVVKARFAREENSHLLDKPEADLEWTELAMRNLIDEVLNFGRLHAVAV